MCQKIAERESGYSVSVTVDQSWDGGFNGTIILTNNTDTAIEDWELTFDTNFTITEITSSWAGTITTLEPYIYMLKGSYTNAIAANSSVYLGFSGVKNGTPEITSSSLSEVTVDEEMLYDLVNGKDFTLSDLEALNANNYYPLEVVTDDNGYVTSIDGEFSDVSVVDADSALEAISTVRTLLGITDPDTELALDYIYDSPVSDYSSYFFHQVKSGLPVYGRSVTVVARDTGKTVSLDSSFRKITSYDDSNYFSANDIASQYGAEKVYEVVYSFDEYYETPTTAYIVNLDEESYIVSSETGSIISKIDGTQYNEIDVNNYAIDVYNVTPSSVTDSDGNLIYYRGDFGEVKNSSNETVELSFDSNELNELGINSSDIDFEFAEKGKDNYILQTVPPEDYDTYINSHEVITGIKSYLGKSTDDDGNYFVDVAVDVYHFDEYYMDYKVYGRVISLTLNDEEETIIMDSNIVGIDYLDDVEIPTTIMSLEDVKSNNSLLTNLEVEIDEPVLYTWDEYESAPELVYIFLDKNNNRTYLVSANGGSILNENDDYYQLGKGLDEGGSSNGSSVGRTLQYFPIQSDGEMSTIIPHTVDDVTYNNSIYVKYSTGDMVQSASTYFYEPEAVSAYLSVLTAYKFYSDSPLNHNSYNNNINGQENTFVIKIKTNSKVGAAASTSYSNMTTYRRGFDRVGYGANLAVVAHEYSHCVYNAFGNTRLDGTTSAALSEGYAGVMGNMVNNWNGYNYDLETKFDVDFEEVSLNYLIESGYVTAKGHSLGEYISYPAYLMFQNGMTNSEVALLYYTSMTMGRYSRISNLNSVRINVIKAAKALNYSDEYMQIITNAFDTIWGNSNDEFTLTLVLEDYDDSSIEITDATIVLRNDDETIVMPENQATVVEPGWYTINITSDGYVPYNYSFYMGMSDNTRTIKLVENSSNNGSAVIKVVDFIDWNPVDETVKLYTLDADLNRTPVGEYQTGSTVGEETGYTQSISLAPGYYLAYVENGYHYFYLPLIVSSGQTTSSTVNTYYDLNLNPNETTDVYYFDTNIYSESSLTDNLSFYTLAVDHYYDDGNKIAAVGRDSNPYGYRFYLYCYEREDEVFSVGFNINSNDAAILQNIVDQEQSLSVNSGHDCTGKLFNLEITFKNRQDSEYSHTIVLTASDLSEGFNSFATVQYDDNLQTYVTTSSY